MHCMSEDSVAKQCISTNINTEYKYNIHSTFRSTLTVWQHVTLQPTDTAVSYTRLYLLTAQGFDPTQEIAAYRILSVSIIRPKT